MEIARALSVHKCKATIIGEIDYNTEKYGIRTCNVGELIKQSKLNNKKLLITYLSNIKHADKDYKIKEIE
jgi:hypothetical protein